jgi:SAM-dependent methyltransferase
VFEVVALCQDITELRFPDATFDAICAYYAIIHIPRQAHAALLQHFYRLLKPSSLALLCLGAEDLENDFVEDYLGARMYWSHYDVETCLGVISASGFELIWSQEVADASSPGSDHLFVWMQKARA